MQLLLYLIVILVCDFTVAKWTLVMDYLEQCSDAQNLPMVYKDTRITNGADHFAVNYNINIKRDLPSKMEATISLEKCSSKENLDSCSHFYKFKTGSYCNFMGAKHEAWSDFVNCITPEYKCPVKKGLYKARNCTMDFSRFKMFPLQSGVYWRSKTQIYEKKRPPVNVSCIISGGGIRSVH